MGFRTRICAKVQLESKSVERKYCYFALQNSGVLNRDVPL